MKRKTKYLEKYYNYLDDLRDSGEINMWGSPAYLAREYSLDVKDAKAIVSDWMITFADRQKRLQASSQK